MMSTRKLARGAQIAAAAGVLLLAAACGKSTPSGSSLPTVFTPSAAAAPTVVKAGEADVKQLFGHCIPPGALAQIKLIEPHAGQAARAAMMGCMGVPKQSRQAAAACALGKVEHGGKLPKGLPAKEMALLNDAYPCVKQYQDAGK
jgi:hypothetical protein